MVGLEAGRSGRESRTRGRGPWAWAVLVPAIAAGATWAVAAEGPSAVVLRETFDRGTAAQVRIELSADGLFRPGLPRNEMKEGAKMPRPLAIKVRTRLIFYERVLDLFDDPAAIKIGGSPAVASAGVAPGPTPPRGRPRKSVRHVVQAAAAISGEVRSHTAQLRPDIPLLVAERRRGDATATVVCPAGPLERSELELVEVEGDPLILSEILPDGPVAPGQSWPVGKAAVLGISGYDTITRNALEATLERLEVDRATIRVRGRIEGSLQGATGAMACDGLLSFDRRLGWIDRFEINRNENRRPGPVEAGMDAKSTILVTRKVEQPPATLSDAALARVSLEVSPRTERLVEHGPDGRSEFLHDRNWHVVGGDGKRILVLKRMEGPKVVAQCNLMVEQPAGPGKHLDPKVFREEATRALGGRSSVEFLGMGEIPGDPADGYRYKVAVQRLEGGLPVVRYYYLIAAPTGEQLVVSYILAAQDVPSFGEEDVAMMKSLRWLPVNQAALPR